MNQIALMRQMFNYNKALAEKTISIITILQEQTENAFILLIDKNDLLSEQRKKAITEWVDIFNTNRKEFMAKFDKSCKGIDKVFADYEK